MKTLKAVFWGGVAGFALGWLFAPRRVDVLRAEMEEQQGWAGSGPTSRSATTAQRGQPNQARYIGNAHTKVFHDASDGNLPSEENRVYFGSAEEAEAQGYRHAESASAQV